MRPDKSAIMGRRKDKNHNEIRDALRQCGNFCVDTYRQGDGFVDLLLVLRGTEIVILIEVKRWGEQLTPKEVEFHKIYPGHILIVYGVEDAIDKVEGLYEELVLQRRKN